MEFESPALRKMAEDLERHYQKEGRLHLPDLFEQAEENLRKRLSELVFQEGSSAGDGRKILTDCIRKIREKKLKREKEELLRRIKEVEEEGGEKGLEVLLTQHQEMVRKEIRLQQQVPSRKD